MRIAVFDHLTVPTNAIGRCNLHLLRGLCGEHEFTVFSIRFDNPRPDRIRWVRVPAPVRPGALTFLVFYLVAPICYWWHRFRYGARFDIVQFVSGDLSFGDISSAHFCSRAHLRSHWRHSRPRGVRRLARWLSYQLRALNEPLAFRRARLIAVCSRGLGREITGEYPFSRGKVRLCHNGVDIHWMQKRSDFDCTNFREKLGLDCGDIVLSFTALGAFELKGLPLLFDALSNIHEPRLKLVVVGGRSGIVAPFRARAQELGLESRVIFVGNQQDVRPYLWVSDGFALPSQHEAFPMAVLEAAAAGLPLLVTRLNGVEEFFVDGENGILIAERSADGILQAVCRFLMLSPEQRQAMGACAQRAVAQFSIERFVATWRELYRELVAREGDSAEAGFGCRGSQEVTANRDVHGRLIHTHDARPSQ